ncbi:MAG: hypothetical protein AAGJ52_00465 [Pseudomonadota bacterium]
MSTTDSFIVHSAEQVLRFTRADNWDALPEARKVQLGFNLGVLALGLGLEKEDSFDALTATREGRLSGSLAASDHCT